MKTKLEALETRQCVTELEACLVDDTKRCFPELNDEHRKAHGPLKNLFDVSKVFKGDPALKKCKVGSPMCPLQLRDLKSVNEISEL
jgi:hypothetical protein